MAQQFAGARAVVFGGAGFLGSHTVEALVALDAHVTVVDNLVTGSKSNLTSVGKVDFIEADICEPVDVEGPIDFVLNFASIAAPPKYRLQSIETLRAGSIGVEHALQMAVEHDAVFFQASTSEVYGDPTVVPQPESYWGNVNPIGPRSMYDESKRYAEALTTAYADRFDAKVRIARIFNTYGPRMDLDDGRAVPAFIKAAFSGRPLPVHGDGLQTRSLCYVDDLVEGICRLLVTDHRFPVNLGTTEEVTMLEVAKTLLELSGSTSGIEHEPRPADDPQRRRPDTSAARALLDFDPAYDLELGLIRTLSWFAEREGFTLVIDIDRVPAETH